MNKLIVSVGSVLWRISCSISRFQEFFEGFTGWKKLKRALYFIFSIIFGNYSVKIIYGISQYAAVVTLWEKLLRPFMVGCSLVFFVIFVVEWALDFSRNYDPALSERVKYNGTHEAGHLLMFGFVLDELKENPCCSRFVDRLRVSILQTVSGAQLVISWTGMCYQNYVDPLRSMDLLIAGIVAEEMMYDSTTWGGEKDHREWSALAGRWLSHNRNEYRYFGTPSCLMEAELNADTQRQFFEESADRVRKFLYLNRDLLEEITEDYIKHRRINDSKCRYYLKQIKFDEGYKEAIS